MVLKMFAQNRRGCVGKWDTREVGDSGYLLVASDPGGGARHADSEPYARKIRPITGRAPVTGRPLVKERNSGKTLGKKYGRKPANRRETAGAGVAFAATSGNRGACALLMP